MKQKGTEQRCSKVQQKRVKTKRDKTRDLMLKQKGTK